MRKLFLLICLLLNIFNSYKQIAKDPKPKQLVNDTIIYSFLNEGFSSKNIIFKDCDVVLSRDLIPSPRTLDKSDSLEIAKQKIFSKYDLDFIFKQAKYIPCFRLNPKQLTRKRIEVIDISKAFGKNGSFNHKYEKELHEKYHCLGFLMMPLFSLDKKTAVINISYICGPLWGAGGTYIYHKLNNKWILIATLSDWVS